MSDIEVLEIEIDDTDLIDEPERRVVLQELEEELKNGDGSQWKTNR